MFLCLLPANKVNSLTVVPNTGEVKMVSIIYYSIIALELIMYLLCANLEPTSP